MILWKYDVTLDWNYLLLQKLRADKQQQGEALASDSALQEKAQEISRLAEELEKIRRENDVSVVA